MIAQAYDQLWRETQAYLTAVGQPAVPLDPVSVFRAGGLEPDPAQEELLACRDPNVLVLWTRQFAGKSQTAAAIALCSALTQVGSLTLIFSAGQRESKELLRKVRHLRYGLLHRQLLNNGRGFKPRSVLEDVSRYQSFLSGGPAVVGALGAVTDAQTIIELENGSRIISLPASSQAGVGFTADLLIMDEAKVIPDDLYKSVRSTMATRRGRRMIALTTPLGQRGWFWEAWKQCDDAALRGEPEPYRRFKRTCWECPRLDREFIENERRLIGDLWFRQEYECEFVSRQGMVFRMEDIDRSLQSKEQPYEVPWG